VQRVTAGEGLRASLTPDPDAGACARVPDTCPHEQRLAIVGNRSAVDWVLDQHKEKTPKDPIIRERFNTYRFADHKERAIDLLRRVVTVSVRTVDIVQAMRAAPR